MFLTLVSLFLYSPVSGPEGQEEYIWRFGEDCGQSGCTGITILPSDPDDIMGLALVRLF